MKSKDQIHPQQKLLNEKPESLRQRLSRGATRAESSLCYACGSCLTACPVNLATNQLQPRKLVMMANLGLIEELLQLSEIWYCLSCKRCNHACPMAVKPAALIAHLRLESIRRSLVKKAVLSDIEELQRQLHRVRAHVAAALLSGRDPGSLPDWLELAALPLGYSEQDFSAGEIPVNAAFVRTTCGSYLGYPTNLSECLTCGECSNACPVCHEPELFDPMWMIRMMNLGFAADLLVSPMMWLCIDCETCTHACTQRVRVHLFIRRIQQIALQEGHVSAAFARAWKLAQKVIYCSFIEEVNRLLAVQEAAVTLPGKSAQNHFAQLCPPALKGLPRHLNRIDPGNTALLRP